MSPASSTAHGDIINFNRYYPPFAPGTPGRRVNLADRDYFKVDDDGAHDGPFISLPVQNPVTGEWTFYLARQIRDRAGQPIGVASPASTAASSRISSRR